MKTICYCLTILLGLGMFATANNNPTKISAKEIELVSGDGKHTLTLAAQDNGVGLWVRNNDRKTYAYMYSGKIHGPNISLGNEGKGGDPLALSLDEDGKPWIQMVTDGKLNIFEADDVIKVEKAKKKVKSFRRRGGCRPSSSCGAATPYQPVAAAVNATANVLTAPVRVLGGCAGGSCPR